MKRDYPEQPLVGVGAIVVDSHDRVLLVERGQAPLAGYWSVPGGLVELGEEARTAAAREVREEAGIEVEVGPVVAVVDRIERDAAGRVQYHYVLIDYLARRTGSARLQAASDAQQARWVEWRDLDSYRLTPGLAEVLQTARKMGP